ncbi:MULTISPECIES: Ig-like domain-containing protein [unclassified Rudaea]|uniref:Ig-like domain-containing protein n=1 Tax=unclassified Rudaea TaxID=2627037 RepID=UPI00148583F7|nr:MULTISPECIES: Ig-like domain-containing protein [unclassified Rudaea]
MYRRQQIFIRARTTRGSCRYAAGIAARILAALALATAMAPVFAAGTMVATVSLFATPNPSQLHQSVHFGVVVAGTGGTYPTGTVNVHDVNDNVDICTALPLAGSGGTKTASCDYANLSLRTTELYAYYSGDANYAQASSTPHLQQTVNGMELWPTVTLGMEYSANPYILARVIGNSPTGTVTFADTDTLQTICANVPLTGSGNERTALCNSSSLALTPGTHNVGATYSGDANNPSYVSANVTYGVVNAVSHTSLASPGSGDVSVGQNIHFSARLSVDAGVTIPPTGTIKFIDGGADGSTATVLCQTAAVQDAPGALTATAGCNATISNPGSHLIGTDFRPDSPYMTSAGSSNDATLSVRTNPTLTLTGSVASSVVGQPVTLTATLSGAVNPTGTVQFANGRPQCAAVPLTAAGSGYTATCTYSAGGTGTYSWIATFAGDNLNQSASARFAVNSSKADTRISSVVASPATIGLGGSTTVTFTFGSVAPSDGGFTDSGSIGVSDGSASCAPIAVSSSPSPLQLSCILSPTSVGNKTLTVTFAGSSYYNPSTGTGTLSVINAAATYTVTPNAGPNGSIAPATPQTVNAGATATFSVSANPGYAATVGGSCGGSLSGNVYTTAPVGANCSVVASFASTAAANVNLNQFGLSGSWYNQTTSGQGIMLSTLPDQSSPGHGVAFAGWFTYDVAPGGGPEKQRWYALQGPIDNINHVATLTIYKGNGGNFDAPPRITATPVGSATLQFADCQHGTLIYSFTDGSGRSGTIPLTRLDASITCSPSGDNGVSAPSYLLTTSWYNRATSGQGIFTVVNPDQHVLFMAWYTYMPNGLASGDASQRWYVLQLGPDIPYTASIVPASGIPIYTGTDGVFDNPAPYVRTQVGTATLTFIDCANLRLSYTFTGGTNAGVSGSTDLIRLGNAPTACGL